MSPLKLTADRSLTQVFPTGFFFSGTPRMTSAADDHDDDKKEEEDPNWTWEVVDQVSCLNVKMLM